MAEQRNKLILAVLQEDDYESTVAALTQHGFFVTKLSSSGGFLKKKNITILVGVEAARYVELMDIIKGRAGRRKMTVYTTSAVMPGGDMAASVSPIPVEVPTGGATVFTLELEGLEKF